MRYLKNFESVSEPTMREKLESIAEMAYYLMDNDMLGDLGNFIGNCSVLFTGCVDVRTTNSKATRLGAFYSLNHPKRMYRFEIDKFLDRLEGSYDRDKKIKSIDELYKLSLIPKHSDTEEDIEKLVSPVTSMSFFGGKIFESHKIKKYMNIQRKMPGWQIEMKLMEGVIDFEFTNKEIQNFIDIKRYGGSHPSRISSEEAKEGLKEVEKDFYKVYHQIKRKINSTNFGKYGVEVSESSFFYDYQNIKMYLIPK